MAGLCITFLGISQNYLNDVYLSFAVSTASLLFISSSLFIFVDSVNTQWGMSNKKEHMDVNNTFFWRMGKWSFFS